MKIKRQIWVLYLAFIPVFAICIVSCSDDLPDANLSRVTTHHPWKVWAEKAVMEGLVTCDGGGTVSARGFVWSQLPQPTLADNSTLDGTGTGPFTGLITGLEPDQTYRVRAYATNCAGTAYGATFLFKTRKGSVTDIDGNVYPTVIIGNYEWMAENLRVKHYANGDPIPTGLNNQEWEGADFGAYAVYPGIYTEAEMIEAYGLLYNWFVVEDPRGICPAGWLVPTTMHWSRLSGDLGGMEESGGTLKSRRTEPNPHPRWNSPNPATDQSGWSAMPGGRRLWNGNYSGIGTHGNWLSATPRDELHVWSRFIFFEHETLYTNYSWKQNANSIRCVRKVSK